MLVFSLFFAQFCYERRADPCLPLQGYQCVLCCTALWWYVLWTMVVLVVVWPPSFPGLDMSVLAGPAQADSVRHRPWSSAATSQQVTPSLLSSSVASITSLLSSSVSSIITLLSSSVTSLPAQTRMRGSLCSVFVLLLSSVSPEPGPDPARDRGQSGDSLSDSSQESEQWTGVISESLSGVEQELVTRYLLSRLLDSQQTDVDRQEL